MRVTRTSTRNGVIRGMFVIAKMPCTRALNSPHLNLLSRFTAPQTSSKGRSSGMAECLAHIRWRAHHSADDEWETPPAVLDMLLRYVPLRTRIWEPFWCTGRSGWLMHSRGFRVRHVPADFYATRTPPRVDAIITNPPYSNRRRLFQRLHELNMPFAVLVPSNTISCCYFSQLFGHPARASRIQLLYARRRIHFIRGNRVQRGCAFDTVWVCYDMNLPHGVNYERPRPTTFDRRIADALDAIDVGIVIPDSTASPSDEGADPRRYGGVDHPLPQPSDVVSAVGSSPV